MGSTRVGQNIDYDKLTLEVQTNGTMSASGSGFSSAKIVGRPYKAFVNLSENISGMDILVSREKDKRQKISENEHRRLDLSMRSFNCLKRANINTVEDLSKRTEEDMLKGAQSWQKVFKKKLSAN